MYVCGLNSTWKRSSFIGDRKSKICDARERAGFTLRTGRLVSVIIPKNHRAACLSPHTNIEEHPPPGGEASHVTLPHLFSLRLDHGVEEPSADHVFGSLAAQTSPLVVLIQKYLFLLVWDHCDRLGSEQGPCSSQYLIGTQQPLQKQPKQQQQHHGQPKGSTDLGAIERLE